MNLNKHELNQLIDWCVWVGFTAGQHKEGDYIAEANSIKKDVAKSDISLPKYILGEQ